MDINDILLHLSLIEGVGPATIAKIVSSTSLNEVAHVYKWSVNDFLSIGITEKQAQVLVKGLLDKQKLYQELDALEQHRVSWVTIYDEQYPSLLKHIYLPPIGLYVRGVLPKQQSLAVVGSRDAYVYAQKVVDLIIPDLVKVGCAIVSGGALGVDTMAHKSALTHGGSTVAVLGSGLLRPYPLHNSYLFDAIVEQGGAIVSPFPLKQVPLAGNFPARNRVISGISVGSIVVQAARKSGALITARYALEQGREVFAIPGSIMDSLSEGCNDLIKQGACLVTSAQDVLESLGIKCAENNVLTAFKKQDNNSAIIFEDSEKNRMACMVLNLCQQPLSVDDLVLHSGFSINEIQGLLFDLQLQDKVKQDFTGLWISC